MKLQPLPTRVLRVRKAVKHYFNHRERWWDVSSQDLHEWHAGWTTLRAAGALGEIGWESVLPDTEAEQVALGGYELLHEAAERACDEARSRGTIFPDDTPGREIFVGRGGVSVVVALRGEPLRGRYFIITVYRPEHYLLRDPIVDPDRRAIARFRRELGLDERRSVRKAIRGASLWSEAHRPPGKERNHDEE